MLLAIDVGNTNIVFAIFDGNKIAGQWRLSTDNKRTADEYAIFLKSLMAMKDISFSSVSDIIISSVVPQNLFSISKFCDDYFAINPLIVGDKNVEIGMQVYLDCKSEVGADRLVNAVAAYNKFGGDVVIIDFGTATTFDVIDGNGNYIGGLISPGINLSIDALHRAAAKLPEIAVARPKKVIGTSTISAMQSGVYFGYTGLIEGIISNIEKEYGKKMTIIATGGLAALFAKATEKIAHLESDLTINGLKEIFDINRRKNIA